jgi:hypothetical protein
MRTEALNGLKKGDIVEHANQIAIGASGST